MKEAAPAAAADKPTLETPGEQKAKPLRDDIASIINKIKLPERITVRMSGELPKPPAPPASAPAAPLAQEQAPVRPPEQAPDKNTDAQKESATSIHSVHTLKDDLQNVVRDKKMSLVRAVALESEKKKGQEHLGIPSTRAQKSRSRKILGIAFVGVIFLALGIIAYFGIQSVLQQRTNSPQQSAASSLIFAEKTFTFPQETHTGIDLRRTLLAQIRDVTGIPLGAIVRIVPSSSQTAADGTAALQEQNIGDFLGAIGALVTPELIRSLRGDFFLGFHQTVEKLAPVIIIPVTSYERAFAGMLAWEPTMNADLSPLFTAVPSQMVNERGLLVEREFQDSLINNYDVRILKDDSGITRLLYAFPTRTMLIISESPYSFTEALSRLRASRQL